MAKDAVEKIKNAEQRAYEIVNRAKADAKEMTDNVLTEKKTRVEKSIAAARNEVLMRDAEIKKICDEKFRSETEKYRSDVEKSFSAAEKRIAETAGKIAEEIFI